jgi:propionate CoA-transferase
VIVKDGKLNIVNEGSVMKAVKSVEHITFSGEYARMRGQKVVYVTERAVFELEKEGIVLKEIALGVDLERDILSKMSF